jgi:hypothetical protein
VVGISLGGSGTTNFVGTYPEKVAAAMALCGRGSPPDFCGLTKVPFWIMHGTADKQVPVSESQKIVNEMKKCGDISLVRLDKLAGVNHSHLARVFYLPMIYEWLFSHSLTDSPRHMNRDFTMTPATLNEAYKNIEKTEIEIINFNANKDTNTATDSCSSPTYHIVKQGDTLGAIARKYHTSVSQLCTINKMKAESILRIGQKIRVR